MFSVLLSNCPHSSQAIPKEIFPTGILVQITWKCQSCPYQASPMDGLTFTFVCVRNSLFCEFCVNANWHHWNPVARLFHCEYAVLHDRVHMLFVVCKTRFVLDSSFELDQQFRPILNLRVWTFPRKFLDLTEKRQSLHFLYCISVFCILLFCVQVVSFCPHFFRNSWANYFFALFFTNKLIKLCANKTLSKRQSYSCD